MSQSPELSEDVHKQLLAGLNVFRPSRLRTKDDINIAVNVLEDSLDDESIGPIILCSLQPEHPYVFEFIVSAVSEQSANLISRFVLERLPSDIDGFRASLGYKTLSRVSLSLSRLSYSSGQQSAHLDDHRRKVEMAPTLLQDLSKLLREEFFDEAETDRKEKKRNAHRGKTQRLKVVSDEHLRINDQLFQTLGSDAPRTRDEGEEAVRSIIGAQKDILNYFAALLRKPETASLVRSAYFRENVLQGNLSISDEPADGATSSTMGPSPSSLAITAEPIQADLYFESPAGYGKWRILCSRLFLDGLARNGAQSGPVLARLEELSMGCFSETNQKRLTKDSPIEIYRARLPGSVRLVYHIDVIHEFGKDYETQVLKALGIYSMDELNRTDWDKLGKYRARKGSEYIARCKARNCSHGFFFDPVTFDATSRTVEAVFADPESPEMGDVEGVDEIHRLLDLEQYAILSQNIIRDVLEGNNYPRVFQVSPEEKKVVESTRSSFVLGRSGTGKTTIIVFKIFGIERAWQNQGCVGPRPRQLFITKSRLLAEKVERDYVSLLYSLSAGPDSDAPLYVHKRIQRWNSRRKKEIFNPDDTESVREDLPEKFSELLDSHFPLFLTMDTLSSLLEADMKSAQGSIGSRNLRSKKRNQEWYGRSDLVTFDVFKRVYWPRLPMTTKGLSPSLAFSDILGTIKGSEKSLDYPNRALDKESCEGLRNTHGLDYALFEAYQRLKAKRGERDLADRTHALLTELKENGLRGELADFVYVDEVQDLLLIDTRLIISLCRNPDGLLWAGDTAQTISIGSTFTFKQLGASVYRYQRSIRALRGTPRQPEGFQLLKNYRSDGGIVECANAIIRLLQRFPGAIDLLRPEAGVGEKLPNFFHGDGLPQGRDFFLSASGRLAKLGHNQCIIVRDDAARESFKTEIGRVGVTLTIFNSKGLEYDDVILYNFFEESVAEKLWRYLTDGDQHKLEDIKYAPLIHELKYLYVAITRAKERLWIVDYTNLCEPLMRCLLDRGLIIEPRATRNPLESFVNESTSGEWSEEGNRLLGHREYEEAILAFDNAGDDYMVAVSTAYQYQEVARDTPEPETRRRREAFKKAASAFEHCAEIAKSAPEESTHYASAARCYAEVKCHRDVVRALKLAKMFTEAASYCFDNNLLDIAVSIIKKHEAEVDLGTTESIKQVARMSYLESQDLEKAADLFKDDEEQMMEFVVEHDLGLTRAVMLGRQGRYGEAVRQYLDEGQELEALDLALEHTDVVMQNVEAFKAIVDKFLWRYLSFGCREWPESAGVPFEKICMLLRRIPAASLSDRDKKMLFIFKLNLNNVKSTDTHKIALTLSNHVVRCDSLRLDRAVKLLALDYFFDDMSSALDVSSQTGIVSSLELFYEYSLLIRDAALDKAPWDSPWLCALFQTEKDGEGVRIRPGTFTYEESRKLVSSQVRSEEHLENTAVSLSREEFARILTRLLSERLDTRIRWKDRMTSRLHLFDPCIHLTLYRTCHRDHIAAHQLDEGWFNRRARFHLQKIMILDNLHDCGLVDFPSRIKSQRRLLNTLGNALNPLLYQSGSISTLNEDLIPEAVDGFSTVKRWAFDVLYSLDPSRQELQGAFLTNLCTAFTLGRLQKEGVTVNDYLFRIPCTSFPKQWHPRFIVSRSNGSKEYELFPLLGFMNGTGGNLAHGVSFFRFLVRERIPIDLAVLCDIVERLFGLAIMIGKYSVGLHGVLLPRSWVLALWKDFTDFKDRPQAPFWVLAQETERLLRGIYSGDYLSDTIDFGSQDPKNKTTNWSNDLPRKFLQDLCVSRICRCLCLLGENFSDLRNDVVRTMVSLRTTDGPESTAFHLRYINVGNWQNLAEVLYQSTPLPFDRLVKFHQRIFRIPTPHENVQLVIFEEMKSIPDALRSHPTARKHHKRPGFDIINASHSNSLAAGRIDDPGDIPSGEQRSEGLAEYSAQDTIDDGDKEELDKTKGAVVCQKAFRLRQLRRRAAKDDEDNSNDALRIGRNRLFNACKASVNTVHVKYRKLYLGPLPHLLLCLEWIVTYAESSKVAIKVRRAEATLQEMSESMVQYKVISEILDEAITFQKRMELGSWIHPRKNLKGNWDDKLHLEPLRSIVTKTRDILERLSDLEPDQDVPFDEFELAWNGIMPIRLRERKKNQFNGC